MEHFLGFGELRAPNARAKHFVKVVTKCSTDFFSVSSSREKNFHKKNSWKILTFFGQIFLALGSKM